MVHSKGALHYQEIMDDPSVPEDQKVELVESLWAIAVACVDLGLGLHPLQQACGQFELYSEVPNMLSPDVIDCKHIAKDEFEAVNPASVMDSKAKQATEEEESHEPSI
jgi:hypothetical protein